MSEFETPKKKEVRINEKENMERSDSGNFPKVKRKLFTITPYDVARAHNDIKNEKHYGVEPGGLMTGPELSNMYENYKDPNSEKYQKLWGTVEFKPDDDFSNDLLDPNKKPRYRGGKKSRKYRKSRKSKKSRKTRKTKRKH